MFCPGKLQLLLEDDAVSWKQASKSIIIRNEDTILHLVCQFIFGMNWLAYFKSLQLNLNNEECVFLIKLAIMTLISMLLCDCSFVVPARVALCVSRRNGIEHLKSALTKYNFSARICIISNAKMGRFLFLSLQRERPGGVRAQGGNRMVAPERIS